MTIPQRFSVGDWIYAELGANRGKSTTITYVCNGAYFGYFCGSLITINFEDAVAY